MWWNECKLNEWGVTNNMSHRNRYKWNYRRVREVLYLTLQGWRSDKTNFTPLFYSYLYLSIKNLGLKGLSFNLLGHHVPCSLFFDSKSPPLRSKGRTVCHQGVILGLKSLDPVPLFFFFWETSLLHLCRNKWNNLVDDSVKDLK